MNRRQFIFGSVCATVASLLPAPPFGANDKSHSVTHLPYSEPCEHVSTLVVEPSDLKNPSDNALKRHIEKTLKNLSWPPMDSIKIAVEESYSDEFFFRRDVIALQVTLTPGQVL